LKRRCLAFARRLRASSLGLPRSAVGGPPSRDRMTGRAACLGAAARDAMARRGGRTPRLLCVLGAGCLASTPINVQITRNSVTFSDRAAEARADEAAGQLKLYQQSISAMKLLRQRGFTVVREDAGVRVDNARCTFAELEVKAARERRLLEAARPG